MCVVVLCVLCVMFVCVAHIVCVCCSCGMFIDIYRESVCCQALINTIMHMYGCVWWGAYVHEQFSCIIVLQCCTQWGIVCGVVVWWCCLVCHYSYILLVYMCGYVVVCIQMVVSCCGDDCVFDQIPWCVVLCLMCLAMSYIHRSYVFNWIVYVYAWTCWCCVDGCWLCIVLLSCADKCGSMLFVLYIYCVMIVNDGHIFVYIVCVYIWYVVVDVYILVMCMFWGSL